MFNNNNPNRPKYTQKEALQIFRLNRHASIDDVRRQFKFLARQYHPDITKIVDKKRAQIEFVKINEAYSILIKYFEQSQSNRGSKFIKNAYSKYASERQILVSADESRNFIITKFINKIEQKEGLDFRIAPALISCTLKKGIYLIKTNSFVNIARIIEKEYVSKKGTDQYNLFYNSFTHVLDSYVRYYRRINNQTAQVLYNHLLIQWERVNVSPIKFNFTSTFSIQNIQRILQSRSIRTPGKQRSAFLQSNSFRQQYFLPMNIFRTKSFKHIVKTTKSKFKNIFSLLNLSVSDKRFTRSRNSNQKSKSR